MTSLCHLSLFSITCSNVVALGASVCHAIYYFVQTTFNTNVYSLWFLLSWTLSETPLGCSDIVPSHQDPVTMVLQDQSFHALQQS